MRRLVSEAILVSLLGALLTLGGAAPAASAADQPGDAPSSIKIKSSGFSMQEAWDELTRQMEAGGTTNWVIVSLSLIGVAFILERAFRLRRKYVVPAGFAEKASELWEKKALGDIERLCERKEYVKTPLARIVAFLVKHRTAKLDDLNDVAGDIASRHLDRHAMLSYPILTVATLAPLLGLFGTVVGMIESFDTVASAGALVNPRMLSGSISKALITTEFGLAVAIPSVFFYSMFRLRTGYLFNLLEEQASTLIADWFIQPAAKEAAHATAKAE